MTFNAETYRIELLNNEDGTYTMLICNNKPGLSLVAKKTDETSKYLSNFDPTQDLTFAAKNEETAFNMALRMARNFFQTLSQKLSNVSCSMGDHHGMDVAFDMAWHTGSEMIEDYKEDGRKTDKFTGLQTFYVGGSITACDKATLPFFVVTPAYKELFKFVVPVETKKPGFSLYFELDPVEYNTKYPYRRKNKSFKPYVGEYTEMDEANDNIHTARKNIDIALAKLEEELSK